MGKKKPTAAPIGVLPDAANVFDSAEHFRMAFEMLGGAPYLPAASGHDPRTFPSITLSAFALELYLKCLGLLDGRGLLKTHDLKTLFSHLSADRQKAISDLYLAEVGAEMIATWKASVPGFDGTAESALELGFDFFERARYAFEYYSQKGDAYLCVQMKKAARTVILLSEPSWALRNRGVF